MCDRLFVLQGRALGEQVHRRRQSQDILLQRVGQGRTGRACRRNRWPRESAPSHMCEATAPRSCGSRWPHRGRRSTTCRRIHCRRCSRTSRLQSWRWTTARAVWEQAQAWAQALWRNWGQLRSRRRTLPTASACWGGSPRTRSGGRCSPCPCAQTRPPSCRLGTRGQRACCRRDQRRRSRHRCRCGTNWTGDCLPLSCTSALQESVPKLWVSCAHGGHSK